MATGKLTLEIVTPSGPALAGTYDEVALPGAPGEFGILAGHRPLVGSVRIGIASFRNGAETTRMVVGRGFVEVSSDRITVLTTACTPREGLDPIPLRKEITDVQEKLALLSVRKDGSSEDDEGGRGEHLVLVERERTLAALLELYGDQPPAILRPYNEDEPFAHAAPLTGDAAREVENNPGE